MNKNKKLKILEITAFSAGICGVWTRVREEAQLLAGRGHEVMVFSSNIFRGGNLKFAKECEVLDNIEIRRFKAKYSFGQNTFFWDFKKEAMKFNPDVIVCHAYRQYYSTKALKIAKKLGIPCFLVTHAPFLEKRLRNWKLNFAIFLYDHFIGRRILNKYTKVIAITKWEIPTLLKLGCRKDKIIYIPNGITNTFFKNKPKSNRNDILFLGRIAPIKSLETLITAISLLKNSSIKLDLVGPAEEDYKIRLLSLIKELKLEKQVIFHPPVYNLNKKIKILDKHSIFILPSKREGMPISLIEAMAREMIVISSKNDGGKEIIRDGKNGFLFDIENSEQLAEKLKLAIKNPPKDIRKNARNSVLQFSWSNLVDKIEKTYFF
jgi:glycosyltransferase involved in cell wall biosynthesis